MVNQSAVPDEKYSFSERVIRTTPSLLYLAKFLRDVAQVLNNAATYLERR